MMNYWGFRIDVHCQDYPDYYVDQLEKHCTLRQGWGYDLSQDLRQLKALGTPPRDQLANLRMYNKVKCGDIILIPRIPKWELVTVVRATADWDDDCKGYTFDIDWERKDYGHQFPAKKITHFHRHNQYIRGDVRSTLKCRSRFWNMTAYAESLEQIVTRSENELVTDQGWEDRFTGPVLAVMRSVNETIANGVHEALLKQFNGAEWEDALAVGLKALFPNYEVERTGGVGEQIHGTDILITMPGPLQNVRYGVAIQVKDWQGDISIDEAVEQIKKADEGWKQERPELRIVDKIVVITGAHISNTTATTAREKDGVTIMTAQELRELLRRMAIAIAAAMDE